MQRAYVKLFFYELFASSRRVECPTTMFWFIFNTAPSHRRLIDRRNLSGSVVAGTFPSSSTVTAMHIVNYCNNLMWRETLFALASFEQKKWRFNNPCRIPICCTCTLFFVAYQIAAISFWMLIFGNFLMPSLSSSWDRFGLCPNWLASLLYTVKNERRRNAVAFRRAWSEPQSGDKNKNTKTRASLVAVRELRKINKKVFLCG